VFCWWLTDVGDKDSCNKGFLANLTWTIIGIVPFIIF